MSVQQTCLTVLGSTGSIGVNTLDVVARHPGRFRVYALTACTDHESMLAQCREHRPAFAVLVDGRAAEQLKAGVIREGLPTEVLSGKAALEQVASDADVDAVMAAIVGAAGLMPTLAAARAGKRVLLANKEALVMSGALFMDAVRRNGAEIVPIDSEHNAIFQCLGGRRDPAKQGVRRIILTASGGPFRERDTASLARATPEEACAHPNWDMGAKISVDSATLMNKGLEVIEACWLFDVGPDDVEVVIHPQSIIHSMVEYDDGSVLAQLGHPDMRIPIASGLGFPRRMSSGLPAIEFADLAALTFERADTGRFPCLLLGYEAAKRGGRAPTVLNAANEVAVARFLDGALGFQQISRVVRQVLETAEPGRDTTIDEVVATDRRARRLAETTIAELQGSPA